MKMIEEVKGNKIHRNLEATSCPGCPSNLVGALLWRIVFEWAEENGAKPIIHGRTCGIGADFHDRSGIGTHDSGAAGLKAAMAHRGIDRPLICVSGDGNLDMGFDEFTTCFQLGYRYMHVVVDNQAYAASANAATGMTDPFSYVASRPFGRVGHPTKGELRPRKHPAMMIMFSGARFAATTATSHVRDFERKVRLGLEHMPSFLHCFTPCSVNWGYDDDDSARVTSLGVNSGMFPLYEYLEGDGFRRSVPFRKDTCRETLAEYLRMQRRYRHMGDDDYRLMEDYVLQVNDLVDKMALGFGSSSAKSGLEVCQEAQV